MTKIFISYSHKDREFVNRIVNDLNYKLPDISVWYDTLLQGGESWADTLAKEIESADIIIAVLSPNYLSSNWAQKELEIAMLRQTKGEAKIIPIKIQPCIPLGLLAKYSWLDFIQDYDQAMYELIKTITIAIAMDKSPDSIDDQGSSFQPESISARELDKIKKELEEAVILFKSRTDDLIHTQEKKDIKDRDKCFIVMPFSDPDLQVVYEDFVKPVIDNECDLACERGDDVFGSNVIMDDILKSIEAARIVVADLTRKNANVFYEVGICHALDKDVLLLAQSIDDVPFDLRHRRVLLYDYSPRGCKRLESKLKENLLAMLSKD